MMHKLPPDEYFKSLSKVPTSGGALIRNSKGEFLIQKHTYRNDWHIAGGMSDENESPRDAVVRETKEEMGIEITNPRLFCIDFAHKPPFDRLLFVFDGGTIDDNAFQQIKLKEDEISEVKFVNREEMMKLLSPLLRIRLENSLLAFDNGTLVYLEDGKEVK